MVFYAPPAAAQVLRTYDTRVQIYAHSEIIPSPGCQSVADLIIIPLSFPLATNTFAFPLSFLSPFPSLPFLTINNQYHFLSYCLTNSTLHDPVNLRSPLSISCRSQGTNTTAIRTNDKQSQLRTYSRRLVIESCMHRLLGLVGNQARL